MTGPGVWLRRIALGLLLGVLVFAALTARMIVQGEAELEISDAAFDRGDLPEAVLHARRAAILYAPGAPHVAAAFERLRAVALGAEATGDVAMARRAWGAVRSAALETRHAFASHEDVLARADDNLARLGSTSTAGRQDTAKLLARDDAPRALWVAVLGLGFALFTAGLVVAGRLGVGPTGEISRKVLISAGLLALFGVAFWTLAVYKA